MNKISLKLSIGCHLSVLLSLEKKKNNKKQNRQGHLKPQRCNILGMFDNIYHTVHVDKNIFFLFLCFQENWPRIYYNRRVKVRQFGGSMENVNTETQV